MNEHEERLHAMLADGQQTWDLSPNDVAAIRWAVNRIDEFERHWAGPEAVAIWNDQHARYERRIAELEANRLDVVRVVDALIESIYESRPQMNAVNEQAWLVATTVLVSLRAKLVKP